MYKFGSNTTDVLHAEDKENVWIKINNSHAIAGKNLYIPYSWPNTLM